MSPTKKKITRTQTQPMVMKYCLDHKGQEFTIQQVMGYTGFSDQQVRSAMYRLVDSGKLPGLATLVQGQIWQYHPSEDVDPEQASIQAPVSRRQRRPAERYEFVGMASGKVLVRPEGGTELFVLTPLEV